MTKVERKPFLCLITHFVTSKPLVFEPSLFPFGVKGMPWFQCMMILNWVERGWLKLESVFIFLCSCAYFEKKRKKRNKKREKEKKRSTPRKKKIKRKKKKRRITKCCYQYVRCWDSGVKPLVVLALVNSFWKIFGYALERSFEWRRKLEVMQWVSGISFDIMSLNYLFYPTRA